MKRVFVFIIIMNLYNLSISVNPPAELPQDLTKEESSGILKDIIRDIYNKLSNMQNANLTVDKKITNVIQDLNQPIDAYRIIVVPSGNNTSSDMQTAIENIVNNIYNIQMSTFSDKGGADNFGNHIATKPVDMAGFYIQISSTIARLVRIEWADGSISTTNNNPLFGNYIKKSGDTMTGNLNMQGYSITNLTSITPPIGNTYIYGYETETGFVQFSGGYEGFLGDSNMGLFIFHKQSGIAYAYKIWGDNGKYYIQNGSLPLITFDFTNNNLITVNVSTFVVNRLEASKIVVSTTVTDVLKFSDNSFFVSTKTVSDADTTLQNQITAVALSSRGVITADGLNDNKTTQSVSVSSVTTKNFLLYSDVGVVTLDVCPDMGLGIGSTGKFTFIRTPGEASLTIYPSYTYSTKYLKIFAYEWEKDERVVFNNLGIDVIGKNVYVGQCSVTQSSGTFPSLTITDISTHTTKGYMKATTIGGTLFIVAGSTLTTTPNFAGEQIWDTNYNMFIASGTGTGAWIWIGKKQ